MSVQKRLIQIATVLCSVCLVAGCSSESGPKYFPVRGEVLLDGNPLADAMILFHPLNADASEIPKPLACSDTGGNFELKDGAPVGEYAITVELRELKQDGDEMIRDGKNLLPEHYRDPQKSGLKFVVEPGSNEVPAIELKTK
jgi:hypothetical protein